ncbi:hypothetical protein [Enhygromyxa salina]|nr:hypothetical protein [Enhygromyxa salina]
MPSGWRIWAALLVVLWTSGCMPVGPDETGEDRVGQIEHVGAVLARRAIETLVATDLADDGHDPVVFPPALETSDFDVGRKHPQSDRPYIASLDPGASNTAARGPPTLI